MYEKSILNIYIYTTIEYIFREVGITGGYGFETKLYTTTNTKAQGGADKVIHGNNNVFLARYVTFNI